MLRRYLRLHAASLAAAIGRIAGQPVAGGLTILVIAIAIALPAGLTVLVHNVDQLSTTWEGAADFAVYLDTEISEDRAREIAAEIEARDDVAATTFISRADALAEFKLRSGFGDALDALDENPLPHTIVVSPAGGASAGIETLALALEAYDETALVQLDTEWVARLRSMLALFGRLVDLATVLLALAVVIVIGNTIRLEINNRSTEIEVMKLVGGTDAFIRRPFLYLGLCYGTCGAAIAAVLIVLALWLLAEPVRDLARLYAASYELTGLTAGDLGRLFGGGAVLGWAGAWLAAARHLKAIEPT